MIVFNMFSHSSLALRLETAMSRMPKFCTLSQVQIKQFCRLSMIKKIGRQSVLTPKWSKPDMMRLCLCLPRSNHHQWRRLQEINDIKSSWRSTRSQKYTYLKEHVELGTHRGAQNTESMIGLTYSDKVDMGYYSHRYIHSSELLKLMF
jgi:hypothetical protein